MPKLTLTQFASLGGKARASKLTPERRSEIARNAGKNRWKKKGDNPLEAILPS